MDLKSKRIIAFSFVLIMLAVPLTAIQLQDEEEDPEAIPPLLVPAAAFVAHHWLGISIGGVFLTGFVAGWVVHDLVSPSASASDNWLRKEEAKLLARSLAEGTTHYANALNNYQNIWGLTQEHWTRQAELTASAYWKQNGTYSPYDTLTDSGTYYNSALMLVNATNQINKQSS